MGLRRKSAGSVVVRMEDAVELCVCVCGGKEGGRGERWDEGARKYMCMNGM